MRSSSISAGRDEVLRLGAVQTDALDVLGQPVLAEREDRRRRVGVGEEPLGREIHALVGGLGRQHHGHQQLEGRVEFQLGRRRRVARLQTAKDLFALGGVHGVAVSRRAALVRVPAQRRWQPACVAGPHLTAALPGDEACPPLSRPAPRRAPAARALCAADGEVVAGSPAMRMRRYRNGRLTRAFCRAAARQLGQRQHLDAVDRTGWHAQLAAGASVDQHRVHELGGADDGVDRTGLDAQRATDAQFLADEGRGARLLGAVGWIEGLERHVQQRRECANPRFAARRALVDVGLAARDRLGIRPAARVAAFRALRLRQQRVDLVCGRHAHAGLDLTAKAQRRKELAKEIPSIGEIVLADWPEGACASQNPPLRFLCVFAPLRLRLARRPSVRPQAAAARRRRCTRQRSIHCAVSFSCTEFCASRAARPGKSTQSSGWSWLKQENT